LRNLNYFRPPVPGYRDLFRAESEQELVPNCLALRPGHFVTFPPEIFYFEPRSPVQHSYGLPSTFSRIQLFTFEFSVWADLGCKTNVAGSKTDPERPGLAARAFGATFATDCWSVHSSCAHQLVPNGSPTTENLDPFNSAELKGPQQLLRIRPEIFNFEPDSGLKLGQTKPKIFDTEARRPETLLRSKGYLKRPDVPEILLSMGNLRVPWFSVCVHATRQIKRNKTLSSLDCCKRRRIIQHTTYVSRLPGCPNVHFPGALVCSTPGEGP
jgi:hypothetical protein